MSRQTSQGECHFCQQTFAKNGMAKHLAACEKRDLTWMPTGKSKVRKAKLLHLLVEGRDLPLYWLHVEVPADASLKTLDSFLRNIWLECCGHLSAFTIDGRRYSIAPMDDFDEKGMSAKLGSVFRPDVKAFHEYDFGTTTDLALKYVSEREADYRGYDVTVLARNEPPEIKCEVCGKPATQVCSGCIWEGEGWVCDRHARDHECGEDMLLPVVNSPRVGMCAYTG
jgi:hypothetical protein